MLEKRQQRANCQCKTELKGFDLEMPIDRAPEPERLWTQMQREKESQSVLEL